MRLNTKKKGHRRELSKDFIKRKLMQDFDAVSSCSNRTERKLKTQSHNKFINTIEFLDYNNVEIHLTNKYKEKIAKELILSEEYICALLGEIKMDHEVQKIVKKLLKNIKVSETKLFQLKSIINTAHQNIKTFVKIIFFYNFVHQKEEFRRILKQFQDKNIFYCLKSLPFQSIQLLRSKILTFVSIILLRYNEKDDLLKIAESCLNSRKIVEKFQGVVNYYQIEDQYYHTTLYLTLKYIELQAKTSKKYYQLLHYIDKEILYAQNLGNKNHITDQIGNIFQLQIKKLKENVESQFQYDYYHSKPISLSNPKFTKENISKINKKDRSMHSLKNRKYRIQSFRNTKIDHDIHPNENIVSSKEKPFQRGIYTPQYIPQDISSKESKYIEMNSKGFKEVYGPGKKNTLYKKFQQQTKKLVKKTKEINKDFFALKVQSSNKEVKQNQTIVGTNILPQYVSVNNKRISLKQSETEIQEVNQQKQINNQKVSFNQSFFRQSLSYSRDNIQYSKLMFKRSSSKCKLQKAERMQQIYQTFSYQKKKTEGKDLRRQMYEIMQVKIPLKHEMKELLSQQIINFNAGLQNTNKQVSNILQNKYCNNFQFIKIWLGKVYICKVMLQTFEQSYMINIKLNTKDYRLQLFRGSHILCQRYLTIWPTIRYLISKRLSCFSLLKKYHHHNHIFMKMVSGNQLLHISDEYYLQKFGMISKEEIEEITICLDSIFKLIIIMVYYSKEKVSSEQQVISITELQYTIDDRYDFLLGNHSKHFSQTRKDIKSCSALRDLNNFKKTSQKSFYPYSKEVKTFKNMPNNTLIHKAYKDTIIIGEQLKLKLALQIYMSTSERIYLMGIIHKSYGNFFYIKLYSMRQKVLNAVNNKSSLEIIAEIVSISHLQWSQTIKFKITWQDLQENFIDVYNFRLFIISVCSQRQKSKYFIDKLIKYILKRTIFKFDPISHWKVQYNRMSNQHQNDNEKLKQKINNFFIQKQVPIMEKHTIEIIENYSCEMSIVPKKQISFKTLYSKKKITMLNYQKRTLMMILSRQSIFTESRAKMTSQKRIWRQERQFNNRLYNVQIFLYEEKVKEEWSAQYKLTNRKNGNINCIMLNWLDLKTILQNQHKPQPFLYLKKQKYSEMSQQSQHSSSSSSEQQQIQESNIKDQQNLNKKITLDDSQIYLNKNKYLIQMINNLSFYYNHNVSKICLSPKQKHYRFNFRSKIKTKKCIHHFISNNNISLPYLQPFEKLCNERIVKMIKIDKQYGFLIFKRNVINEQSYWEIILEFNHKKNHYVYQIKEKKLIGYFNQSREESYFHDIKNSSFSYSINNKSSYINPFTTEYKINYQATISQLFTSKEITIQRQTQGSYELIIMRDRLSMKERILQYFDQKNSFLYNVWICKEEVMLIQLYRCKESRKMKGDQSDFLKMFRKEKLGGIQLKNAYKFYEIENVYGRNQEPTLLEVCSFYFEYVLHQRFKNLNVDESRYLA